MASVERNEVSLSGNMEKFNRPFVILSFAQSSDGFICREDGDSRFSSEADLIEVHKLRSIVDGILIGSNTALKDNPKLTIHKIPLNGHKNPIRIILDSHARLPMDLNVFSDGAAKTILFVSEAALKERLDALKERCEVVVCGASRVDLERVLNDLHNRGIKKLMVEGGGRIIDSFLDGNFVDAMRVYVAPVTCGSGIKVKGVVSDGRQYTIICNDFTIASTRTLGRGVVLDIKRQNS